MIGTTWRKFLFEDSNESEIALYRKHERTGHPLGEASFCILCGQLLLFLHDQLRGLEQNLRALGHWCGGPSGAGFFIRRHGTFEIFLLRLSGPGNLLAGGRVDDR
jgi:hypothetical protein